MKLGLFKFSSLSEHKDIFLVIVIVIVLMMMIVPLPTVLMDILIALNIGAAILVMLLVLQLTKPVEFTTFPSVLLVTTLFRLAISISTTRLILIEGDAGKIVQTFGEVVVQGNLVVGLVIFMIITVVQFLVITKGADRVAEVGARFTLDGLPGKQMSVDADVRAGTINQKQAKEAREILEQETKLFGAMDGAMKFVKGDAVAGLVITAINLIGGIGIGMGQLGYSFSDALGLYALMTIGDGLVAQIPALLISVASGAMVTRVTNPRGTDLATEIGQQVSANKRTMILGGIVIAVFGLIPGFPTLVFFVIGFGMSAIVYFKFKNADKPVEFRHDWLLLLNRNKEIVEKFKERTGNAPDVFIQLPKDLGWESPDRFYSLLLDQVLDSEEELGVPLGTWGFEFSSSEETFSVTLKGEITHPARIYPRAVFVKANASYLDCLEIPLERYCGTKEGCFVSQDYVEKLEEENIPFLDVSQQVVMKVAEVLRQKADQFINLQTTNDLLEIIEFSNKSLVSDLKETLKLNQINTILKLLVEERIPLRQLTRILEAILEWGPKKSDPQLVLQQVRVNVGDFITSLFSKDDLLTVVAVAPSLENHLRDGIRMGDDRQYLVLDGQLTKTVVEQARELLAVHYRNGIDPVLVTQQDVRRALYNVLEKNGIYVPVLSYQEIPSHVTIYPIAFISAEGGSASLT